MFWMKAGIFLIILFALISLSNVCLRRIFKIKKEKKRIFSYRHINKLHKKVDWFIRIGSAIASSVLLYLVIFKELTIIPFLAGLVLLIIIDYSVRAVFEWKYSQNPKQSILTINEMVFLVMALVVAIQSDLLNL